MAGSDVVIRNRSVAVPQEAHTESDTDTPAAELTGSSTPSPESSTANSGTSSETATPNSMSSEQTNAATNALSTKPAKTYPTRSRNPVERYEPTW